MSVPLPTHLERRLLRVATGLSGARRIPELVARLRPAFELEREPLAGFVVVDDERRRVFCHRLDSVRPGLETFELETGASRALAFAAAEHGVRPLAAAADETDPFLVECARRGHPHVVLAPLWFGERLLGAVFMGPRADPGQHEYLNALARILEPHAWNCLTDERFTRGDRRRDALRELSRVINTSLDLRTVLHLARSAVGSIEGHRASWIGLFDEGRTSFRRYDRPSEYHGDGGEPARHPVAGSVLAHLDEIGRTYESDDLADAPAFVHDRDLLAQGVRRYVATPLSTGGKLLGVFLFGSGDPHPPLRVDVWLLENIAVQLALAIHNAQHHEELARLSARREQHNAYLREELKSERDALGMIGATPAMARLRDRIARVAGTDSIVLVSGATGVGKELVARALHEASPRREQPLVKLNCAAIPEGMVESELFGHERGAFTSAVERRIGRFELAHNGTLFLDEIGELSLAVQAKLLRVLQSGEFERVGGAKTLASNARIVAATNRDLSRSLAAGTFRPDLFYRLNVFPIEVPSLAERGEDVPLLARAFVEHFARRMGKRYEAIDAASLAELAARDWPGNVRELRHLIERAVILCDGPVFRLDDEHAPDSLALHPPVERRALPTLEEIGAAHIRAALERAGWVVEGPRGAAAELGLNASTLRFRMKRLGIRRPG